MNFKDPTISYQDLIKTKFGPVAFSWIKSKEGLITNKFGKLMLLMAPGVNEVICLLTTIGESGLNKLNLT